MRRFDPGIWGAVHRRSVVLHQKLLCVMRRFKFGLGLRSLFYRLYGLNLEMASAYNDFLLLIKPNFSRQLTDLMALIQEFI